jgi:hypothetical protein
MILVSTNHPCLSVGHHRAVPRASPGLGDPFGRLDREVAHQGWPSMKAVVARASSMAIVWPKGGGSV